MAISKVIYGTTTLMDLTNDTVEASKLLSGYTAHGRDGEAVTGSCTFDADTSDADATASSILNTKTAYVNGVKVTGDMPNRGGVTGVITDKTVAYSVQNGYHDGSGTVGIDSVEAAKIIPGNIKDGVEILGVTGTYTGQGGTSQAKTATPYTTQQVILPDSGYDYLSQVTVAPIYYHEELNGFNGITVTIGTVAPTP